MAERYTFGHGLAATKCLTADIEMQIRSENWCLRCGELWAMYDAATRRYVDLIKEQASRAATSMKRSQFLDPVIETAIQHVNTARSAIEFHRVLDHEKKTRTMTAGS